MPHTTPIDIARQLLIRTRAAFPFGSDNIRAATYHQATDSYVVNPDLLGVAEGGVSLTRC